MSLQNAYKNDADKEIGGVWMQYKDGVELLIRRAGGLNVSFQKAIQRKLAPHQRKLRQGEELPEELSNKLLAEAYSESIVMDWRTKQADGSYVNTIEWNGEPVAFSRKQCIEVFVGLPDFFQAVREDAGSRAQFTAEAKEDDVKN